MSKSSPSKFPALLRLLKLLVVVVAALAAWRFPAVREFLEQRAGGAPVETGPQAPPPVQDTGGEAVILEAFRERSSEVLVGVSGTVDRQLPDDREGSRHQRFVLRLAGGHTVLVSHNIDLAPRVPVEVGDTVALQGQYEWNAEGGVIHWTHHDPAGRHPGGRIEHAGQTYE